MFIGSPAWAPWVFGFKNSFYNQLQICHKIRTFYDFKVCIDSLNYSKQHLAFLTLKLMVVDFVSSGQVNCIHGGQEWNESSCLLHLGMEIPLSYSDAKTKCQTINGYLAIIDSPEKDQFVRQNVLGSNE